MITIKADDSGVKITRAVPLITVLCTGALLVACGTDGDTTSSSAAAESSGGTGAGSEPVEQTSATKRLAFTHDDGIVIVDADDLEPVGDIATEGFIRLNPAGDGRHVFVSRPEGFGVLDMGTWTRQHGDHGHHYTSQPAMTELVFGGQEPGHVVSHDDRITLFSDGTGDIDVVAPAELSRGKAQTERHQVPAHHGVAVARADGTLVTTVGTEESRSGIQILGPDSAVLATEDGCPGVHGEAIAADGALAFGCQDGLLVVQGNNIQKITSPDAYGRIGNQAGTESSPVVLGDYKVDPEAELERPTRISLTNTQTGELRLIDLGTSYSFRSLARGPQGQALVLGTDGDIHVIDPDSGATIDRIEVVEDWAEPVQWQAPRPTLFVMESTAYVTDPANNRIVAVDLGNGEITADNEFAAVPNELTGVTG